ncbi:MAG: peptide synthetase, partial [Burkholderiales bacterium]
MSLFSCVLVGNESLLIQCAELVRQGGNSINAVVTRNADIRQWAQGLGLRIEKPGPDLASRLTDVDFDWLMSIANLSVIDQALIDKAREGAINFHDGPLPRHAGLNAPVWAILGREKQHGVTWHLMQGGIDEGDILKQKLFDLAPHETALTLNTRCYEAAIESFGELLADLQGGQLQRRPQDLSQRSYHARLDRPAAAARIDLARPAQDVLALIAALDHGSYWNPLCVPKLEIGGRVLAVGSATLETDATAVPPGQVVEATMGGLVVGTGSTAVRLTGLRDMSGQAVCPTTLAKPGDRLALPDAESGQQLTETLARVVAGEAAWRRCLQAPEPVELPSVAAGGRQPDLRPVRLALPASLDGSRLASVVAAWAARISGRASLDLAWRASGAPRLPGYFSSWVPLRLSAGNDALFGDFERQLTTALEAVRRHPAFALDLVLRDPTIRSLSVPQVGVNEEAGAIEGCALTVALSGTHGPTLWFDAGRLPEAAAQELAQRLQRVAEALTAADAASVALGKLTLMSATERQRVLYDWNNTRCDYERQTCVHQFFEQQVRRTPDATAVVFEGESLSYHELNRRANQVAHQLATMGVRPGTLVGLYTRRSLDLLVGALAIQKAGGGYVPLDPAYPADRIALYIEDSGAPV